MSDNEIVETKSQEESTVAIDELTQENASEIASAEDTTQVESATDEEQIEPVDVSTLVGTQAETSEKERNNLYAANRVKDKQLKELREQIEKGQAPEQHTYKPETVDEKPKLSDFTGRLDYMKSLTVIQA